MFCRKIYLLRLYKDIHPEDTETTEDDLTVVTIENVLTRKHYNDLGFMISRKTGKPLILFEAQSKWSINVLFRLWEYVIDTLMNYFINNNISLYDSPKLEIPDIETYIVYTGKSIPRLFTSGELPVDSEGRYILSLNREFFGGEAGKPELTAKVIYLKNGSGILEEYIKFSQIFDRCVPASEDEEERTRGIQEVFRICEKEKILTDYLSKHRGEVEKIMLTMVSPEYIEKSSRKMDGIREVIMAMRAVGQRENDIIDYLIGRFNLTPGYAQNCLDAEWDEEDGIAFA